MLKGLSEGCQRITSSCALKFLAGSLSNAEKKWKRCPECASVIYKEYFTSTDSVQFRSLNDSTFICEMCMEVKSKKKPFTCKTCTNFYCLECMTMHLSVEHNDSDDEEVIQEIDTTIICIICMEAVPCGDSFIFKGSTFSYCFDCRAMYPGLKNIDIEIDNEDGLQDSTFMCEMCIEPVVDQSKIFSIKGCAHSYCSDCVCLYVAAKIQENVTSISCPEPNCSRTLEPEYCQSIMPQDVFDRWNSALCESLIIAAQRFYCPFKNCSTLLINEGDTVVMESECPYCHRLFCVKCKVPWHSEIICEEFQKLNEGEREREDIFLMRVARENNWQRCPQCKFFVERSEGCLFIKCRCGFAFCYNCAAPMENDYHNCFKYNR